MFASFRSLFALRCLCLRTPAASSMSARRSSGLLCRMESSEPWEMMEWVPVPRPESCRMSSTSMRRATVPLMRYSLSPLRYMAPGDGHLVEIHRQRARRNCRARDRPRRDRRPCAPRSRAKMTSSMAWPRRFLALRSPSTHRTASEMFDLPDPLGPTTAVMPGSSVSALRSAKDLKPLRTRDFRYMGA